MHRLIAAALLVRTGAASWASLLFIDQTQIKLSAHSLFHVKAVSRDGHSPTIVEMRKGKAWSQSKAPPKRFLMQTPAVNAGIQGTDWVVEVAADGTTTVSVLSGEVRCYNAQGEVSVRKHEEAVTVPGHAPVKRPLVNPRERVQWVDTYAIQWQRYPELLGDAHYASLVEAVRAGRNDAALEMLTTLPASASLRLLQADLLQASGDLPEARRRLTAGLQDYPADPRFPASLAKLALLTDDEAEAKHLLAQGLARHPESAELWLVKGDLARWQGQRKAAIAAYTRAGELAPQDARSRLAIGRIASEREDYPRGRRDLLAALERSPQWAEALAELGWLETLAEDLPAARRRLEAALAQDPSDYVALTALGYLELKSGHPEAALRDLLAANTIEPRYARAVQTLAIAYYQQGRLQAALDSLSQAAELDPRNPMPSSSGQDRSTDESTLAYLSVKKALVPELLLQADLTHSRVQTNTVNRARVGGVDLLRGDYHDTSRRLQASLGAVYQPGPAWTLRGAVQRWTRPVSFNTLSPISTAGIPVDDVLTLPGGRLQRGKLQLEWHGRRAFSSLWVDRRKVENISFDPLAGPDNGTTELAELSRLNPPSLQSLAIELPEDIPRFASGKVREWGVSHERVLARNLSLHLRYRHAESKNTRWYEGNALPYMPEDQGTVGVVWLPAPRWALQAQAIYRSRRYADAANGVELDAGWDATLLSSWQSYAHDWQVDAYLGSLFNDDQPTRAGVAVSFRF